jgi:hypothetical protein
MLASSPMQKWLVKIDSLRRAVGVERIAGLGGRDV